MAEDKSEVKEAKDRPGEAAGRAAAEERGAGEPAAAEAAGAAGETPVVRKVKSRNTRSVPVGVAQPTMPMPIGTVTTTRGSSFFAGFGK